MCVLRMKPGVKALKNRETSHHDSLNSSPHMRGMSHQTGSTLSSFYSAGPVLSLMELIQPKLNIGQPNDIYEQEADRVAKQVMSHEGKGQSLSTASKDFFEPRFGSDFSKVRVHTGSDASAIATELNARAFTIGKDILFGAGQYTPGNSVGKRLLAHELAHVIQQDANEGSSVRIKHTLPQSNNPVIQCAALHIGRIYDEGSCYHLACNSKYAFEEERYGYTCRPPTRNAGKRMRPLFTCDINKAGALANPCAGNQIAIPDNRGSGFQEECGKDLVVCANGRFIHGIIRDKSSAHVWEIGSSLMNALGVTRGDIQDGAIYPNEEDPQFTLDQRCRD